MGIVQNPILRGFNPDPSIIRVGSDYYIATSTFEWFPGVQIHHSTDLFNWQLIKRPLERVSQLDMKGNPDSCGVWAPCLSYHEGTYYLVYTNVRSFDGVWKDTPNYLVTSRDILGEWSDPVFLGSYGFDGSLFHDDDGRKWFTCMLSDHRKGLFFGGILLQEYDNNERRLVGPVHNIFRGSELGITEAPHLYKRNGYYYLITAEGGTEYGHAVSMARAQNITGPYELHPDNPVITSRNNPAAHLQKSGHADLVETETGDWFAVFLVGRPISNKGRCILGRETAIEEVAWHDDDWLYTKSGNKEPRGSFVIQSEYEDVAVKEKIELSDFNQEVLDINFQSLRVPMDDSWADLGSRPGYLRLYGRESLSSIHEQSLIARRVQAFNIDVSVCLDFEPVTFQQMAGLVAYYNTGHWYYLYVMGNEDARSKCVQITSCDNFEMKDVLEEPVQFDQKSNIRLRLKMDYAKLHFFIGDSGSDWIEIGPVLDASILSDDYVREGSTRYRPAFTGCFVGICCQDLTGHKMHADFAWFKYSEIN